MKPLHIGLLVVGAALAGGLAVKMTQPPTIPVAAVPPAASIPPPGPAVVQKPEVPAPLPAPAPIAAKPAKPSPIPRPAPLPVDNAPAPVYAAALKPLLHPARPALIARVSAPKAAPTQWTPGPYQTPPATQAAKPDPSPEAAKEQAPAPIPAPDLAPARRHVTLVTGMTVAVRLDESLSSDRATPGDNFQASLAEPLVVDSLVIAERGARATGRIIDAQRGARLGSPAMIELALTSVFTSDGQRVALPTDPWFRQAERNDDPIGALFTRPKPANVPTATIIRFRLSSRVTVTEQIAAR